MSVHNAYPSSGKKRLLVLTVLAVLLMFTLFSSCYVLEAADHDCSGASCPVCAMSENCENHLRQMGGGHLVVFVIAAVIDSIYQAAVSDHTEILPTTLITRKVRIND